MSCIERLRHLAEMARVTARVWRKGGHEPVAKNFEDFADLIDDHANQVAAETAVIQ